MNRLTFPPFPSHQWWPFHPAMFGLVSGEMLAGVLLTIHVARYYFVTGMPPKVYNIFGSW